MAPDRKGSKANIDASSLPSMEHIYIVLELGLPLGIGLTEENTVSELNGDVASKEWRVGDRLCWADGKEVRGGKLGVGDAIDRSRQVHELVIQRDAPQSLRAQEYTYMVRLTGNPGLGVGLSAQNAITDITPGGVAFLDGRIQSGDMLIVFDGVGVANGKKGLSQVVKEQKEMIEARGGSLNPWREIILKRRLQPKPPPTEDPKGGRRGSKKDVLAEEPPTKIEWKVRASSLPVDKTERDKKTNAIKGERMVPFALDKKNAMHN